MATWFSNKLSRAHAKFERLRFLTAISGVLKTQPIALAPGGPTVVTMIGCRDLSPYLLALKSFARFCSPGRVVILDDGTLRPIDAEVLDMHLPGVRIIAMGDVPRGKCQRGGCWERLCLIGELSATDYVIQLDSDMLTLRRPHRLIELVQAQCAFTMSGDLEGARIMSGREAADIARQNSDDFFQLRVERELDQLPEAEAWRYVRGCAALSAFPPNTVSLRSIELMHGTYEALVGNAEWRSWGSEQIASNSLIAAIASAVILPSEDYCSHFGSTQPFNYANATMIHFLGTHRFDNGTYRTLATQVIREIA